MAEVLVDTKELEQLGRDIDRAKRELLLQLGRRGWQILRAEVPVRTGKLHTGVQEPDFDIENLTATLTVSAASDAVDARGAQVINAKGEATGKTVSLKAQPAYNYAETVARGNRSATLTPKNAKAFLIPVPSAPVGEGYLLAGGQVFIVRRSRKGQKANPFDERAAKRLTDESPRIGQKVLEEFL